MSNQSNAAGRRAAERLRTEEHAFIRAVLKGRSPVSAPPWPARNGWN